ncbi:hypothetical protein WR25_23319 [Diploscapter pachys]|uniref:SH3 domain-containing protein n=1 Tax=Diploscapter pachys TaxID=2018661 RepID=A0A2A2J7V5_9BILA|nr:hypothetical protein WR25_23319 [Diploscapter pachys]
MRINCELLLHPCISAIHQFCIISSSPSNRNFVYGEAKRDYESDNPNDISFAEGEYIWIIERGIEGRFKGIAFGKRGNSRSGYFPAEAVDIVDKPTCESSFFLYSAKIILRNPVVLPLCYE